MEGPQKPREGAPEPPQGQVAEGGGLATALAATRARGPRGAERRRRSRAVWLAVGAGVVALVLLAAFLVGALYGVHLGTPAHANNGTAPSGVVPTSFYGALPAAIAAARASYWDWPMNGQPPLVFAEGLASPATLGALVNSSHLGTVLCAPTVLSTGISGLPGYSGALTAGLAPAWLFAFNPQGNTLLVLAVVNGTASVVATTVSNGDCYNGPGSFNTVAVDSSVAASVAGATSKSIGFFRNASANSTALSAEFYLVPPGYLAHTPMDPMWVVTDTTCSLYGSAAAPGTTVTSEVNAATGALYAQNVASVTC